MTPTATLAPTLQDCMDRQAAATYLGLAASTLAAWQVSGKYRDVLKPFRYGKRTMYRRACLDAFLESQIAPAAE